MNKKTLYKIHKWAGITIGIFLFFIGVSGVSITFREELLPRSYPQLFYITLGTPLPVAELYQSALNYKSETQEITNLYTSHHLDEAYMIMVRDSKRMFPLIWTINPYTGQILGEISMIKNFYAVMLMIHTNFLAGKVGSYFVGLLGLALSFFIISGLFIFIPKSKSSLRFKKLMSFRWSSQHLHHQLGIFSAPFLLASALTGFFIVFDIPYYMAQAFNAPPRIEEATQVGPCYYQEQIQVLKSITERTASKLISLHFCTPKNSLMKITYGQTERDFLDGYVREIIDPQYNLALQVFDSKIDHSSWNLKRLLIYPIHTGAYFGLVGRIINLLLGLVLTFLFVTGIRLSIKRAGLKRLVINKAGSDQQEVDRELPPFQIED